MKILSIFLILSLSVVAASAWEIVKPPQGTSRLTHYPSWRIPAPWDDQQLDTVIFFSVIATLIAAMVAMKFELFVKSPNISTIRDTYHANSRLFSAVISYYLIATFLAVIGFWILDLGKLWSMVGTLHNLLEVAFLLVMTFSRYPKYFKYFYYILFIYFFVIQWTSLILPWPFDAVIFKFQGLSIDYALTINLVRLYIVNKRNPISEDNASQVDETATGENTPPTSNGQNSPDTPRRNILVRIFHSGRGSDSNGHVKGHSDDDPDSDAIVHTPADSLRILVLASLIHSIGDSITTLNDSFIAFLIFQFSYGVAFPLFAFYVTLVPKDNHIRWFDVSKTSEAIVSVVSIVISGFVLGIHVYLMTKKYQKHDLTMEG